MSTPSDSTAFDPTALRGRDKELWDTIGNIDAWKKAGIIAPTAPDEKLADRLYDFTDEETEDAIHIVTLLVSAFYPPLPDALFPIHCAWDADYSEWAILGLILICSSASQTCASYVHMDKILGAYGDTVESDSPQTGHIIAWKLARFFDPILTDLQAKTQNATT